MSVRCSHELKIGCDLKLQLATATNTRLFPVKASFCVVAVVVDDDVVVVVVVGIISMF